jgi:hypothetical protein
MLTRPSVLYIDFQAFQSNEEKTLLRAAVTRMLADISNK